MGARFDAGVRHTRAPAAGRLKAHSTASDNAGMRRRICTAALALGVTLGLPGVAAAASAPSIAPTPSSAALSATSQVAQSQASNLGAALLNPPSTPARSWTALPTIIVGRSHLVRFSVDARQALLAAEHTSQMQALHHREHPLNYTVDLWSGNVPDWQVYFAYHGTWVAEVDVSRSGRVTAVWTGPLAIATLGRGHFGGLFDSPWVVLTFAALFLVLFLNPRRLRRMAHLDALLLLALFAVPYYLFDHTHFIASYLVLYPLLLLVVARMLWLGLRGRPADDHAPRWPIPVLAVGLLALVAARVALAFIDGNVIDVGVASVIGAHAIAHGQPLYVNGAAHGDTYGPITYLAYVPFEVLFPWRGAWNYVMAAHVAAVFFDVATTVALVALGIRLRPGAAGRRLGLTLAWAWAAYPATLLALMEHTNDGLIALLFVLGLLVYASPVGRGAMLGLAAAAKLFPAILLPLFAAGWRSRDWRQSLVTVAIFAAVVVASFAGFIPAGGVHLIYERTFGFQLGRSDPFSLWGLYPSLGWLNTVVKVAVCALAASLFFLAPRRSIAQVAALSAALVTAVQLPAEHWLYFYLAWIAPLAFVAVLARDPATGPERLFAQPPTGVRLEPPPPAPVAAPAG